MWIRAVFALLALGALLRLPILSTPNEVVFDEVHFGRFAYAYCCTGERFFDLHPPHAKLLIGGALRLAGGAPAFDYTPIGKAYPDTYPLFAFRIVPAIAGMLLPLAMLALLAGFGVPVLPSFVASLGLALDSAWWVHTRFALLDAVQVTATFAALACLVWALRFTGWRFVGLVVAAGVGAGFAVGTKFSGLAVFVPLGLLLLLRGGSPVRVLSAASLGLVSAAVVYVVGWWIHFRIVPGPPQGHDWYMPTGRLFEDMVALHKVMFRANYQLSSGHPDASLPWRWPLMGRAVFYWVGPQSVIYLVGNPVVWLGTPMVLIASVLAWRPRVIREMGFSAWLFRSAPQLILLTGFLVSWLPFVLVKRPLFLYHWLVPLVWLVALAASTDWFAGALNLKKGRLRGAALLAVALTVGFVVMLPFTSGWSILPELRAAIVSRLVIFR